MTCKATKVNLFLLNVCLTNDIKTSVVNQSLYKQSENRKSHTYVQKVKRTRCCVSWQIFVLNHRHVSRRQIEEELAALQKDRTEKVKHLFERQDREMNTFDSESRCLGFGSLGSLDFPKEDNR